MISHQVDKLIMVSLEHRFYSYNDVLYTKLAFDYIYWKQYLSFFDSICIVARVKKVSVLDANMKKVTGENVKFYPMPYYHGVRSFFYKLPHTIFSSYKASCLGGSYILRSGNISNMLWFWLFLKRKPYLREYPGNIKEGIQGVAGKGAVIKLISNFSDWIAKYQAKHSKANSYVSKYCADIYQSNKPSYIFSSFNCDEIQVKKADYKLSDENKLSLIAVGRLEGEKGHEDLINALMYIDKPAELHIIGDGSRLNSLQELAEKNKLNVEFHGAITNRDKMFNLISQSDIYVIPSHTEGMPRALLEAMAIGMPCIGTNVGGIPEVLPNELLVEPKSPECLSELIGKLYANEEYRKICGQRNLSFVIKNYSIDKMNELKVKFWSELYK